MNKVHSDAPEELFLVRNSACKERHGTATWLGEAGLRHILHSLAFAVTIFVLATASIATPHLVFADTHDHLVCPLRSDWKDAPSACPCEERWNPTPEQVDEMLKHHLKWLHARNQGDLNATGRAVFCNSVFPMTNFSNKILDYADFRDADLTKNNVRQLMKETHIMLLGIDFTRADLRHANFSGATISLGIFHNANVSHANFENAYLYFADFGKSEMDETNLAGATFDYVNLAEAEFAPISLPKATDLGSVTGLRELRFPEDKPAGLVELRSVLRNLGFRHQEREVTFAIHSTQVDHLQDSCPPSKWFERPRQSLKDRCSPSRWFHGAWQTVLFEWTTGWGLHPFRAVGIMIILACCLTPIYVCCTWVRGRCCSQSCGIFRVWPRERLDAGGEDFIVAEYVRVERISVRFRYAIAWGLYFSVLSTFHIGWRDLNVAGWITKLQFREYYLRGQGWIRSLSAVQSLVGVYLFALWVLTYFGRPFE